MAFQERKSWLSQQRQSLGPDWTEKMHPDTLNREIEKVIKDLYYGNIGISDPNSNPDFKDLCSFSIVSALHNYYTNKIANMSPVFLIMEEHKKRREEVINSMVEEYRTVEQQKLQDELNNSPTWHFIYECYAYYYEAYNLIDGFINSGYNDFTYMSNFCRLVFKNNNRWSNPGVRFF